MIAAEFEQSDTHLRSDFVREWIRNAFSCQNQQAPFPLRNEGPLRRSVSTQKSHVRTECTLGSLRKQIAFFSTSATASHLNSSE
jgi:hypothetical protein